MEDHTPVAIKVEKVDKVFKLPHEKNNSIKSAVVNFYKLKRSYELQQVLKNVSFDVKEGEFFGIVGRNGSGKSTMLKLLAGIYTPTNGDIGINGKLTPFIELGVGFNVELTGRDNVFLNGALLGFNRSEMTKMYDDIVSFAELENFMDQKLKNYSSGMQVRLAFSIAIRAQSDILLIDEVLAVGDTLFQEKCFRYFDKLKHENKTVILVSHDRGALERFCSRGILIDKGKVVASGAIQEVLEKYDAQNLRDMSGVKDIKNLSHDESKGIVSLHNIKIVDDMGEIRNTFLPKEKINIKFKVKFHKKIESPVFGITVYNKAQETPLLSTNTLIDNTKTGAFDKGDEAVVELSVTEFLNNGIYELSPAVANQNGSIIYRSLDRGAEFQIIAGKNPHSLLNLNEKLKITKK
jgi:ABC-2 type transport system ATP-binding protein